MKVGSITWNFVHYFWKRDTSLKWRIHMWDNYYHVQIKCLFTVNKHILRVGTITWKSINVLFSGCFADLVFVWYYGIIKQLIFADGTSTLHFPYLHILSRGFQLSIGAFLYYHCSTSPPSPPPGRINFPKQCIWWYIQNSYFFTSAKKITCSSYSWWYFTHLITYITLVNSLDNFICL